MGKHVDGCFCQTAGTGKSFLIHCLKILLLVCLRVMAPTGVVAFNVPKV